uniref:RING-type E3 ubiquitin transferase n=3 Tax=Rhizophora mucronata TaxID=61149 RepID=A0A2P2JQW8_RHIMU
MLANKNMTAITVAAESLLTSILEIIESVACIEPEKENLAEFGCYLYRVSPVILEVQKMEDTPENAVDILLALSSSIDEAKCLVGKFKRSANPKNYSELKHAAGKLEGTIKNIGECLSSIPSLTFQNEKYVEVAICSLSNEMQNAHFVVREAQVLHTNELEGDKIFSETEINKESSAVESDLYPVDLDFSNSEVSNLPHAIDFLKSRSLISQSEHDNRSSSSKSSLETAEYLEPLYYSFYCPLTKQVMDDPVTIESGVTYDRKAIKEWFSKFENSQQIFCPTTMHKLSSTELRTNVALKMTIGEWKERNEAAQIKVCRTALSLASSASMIYEAIMDLQGICKRNEHNRMQVCNAGILPLLVKFLAYKEYDVRCAALQLLRQLAEVDDFTKEMIAELVDISTVFKLLSSSHQCIVHVALLLLLELSKSPLMCEKIGMTTGGILMLIRTKYNKSIDAFASKNADEILKNLEIHPENIRRMAENGLLEPLLNHLLEGSEEIQMEMANYLGDISLGHDGKTHVAERASTALINMVHRGNTLSRRAAFKALSQISSYHPNVEVLTKAGVVQTMVEEMFSRRIYSEPMNSKSEASAILANVFEAGIDLENLHVNSHGHKLHSDYVVYNIIDMLKNSSPDELSINIIRVLLCLTKSPKSMGTIVSVVKETEASYTLVELINNPREELVVAAIKLLVTLSPFIGHMLVDRLCMICDQPDNLVLGNCLTTQISEKQAVSVQFLAKLPHQNLRLNLALASNNKVPTILERINQIQSTWTGTSRYARPYLEGLVGILVRFTTTLYEPYILSLARKYNFTAVFTKLLMRASSDEVQRLSAIGLENLSSESVNLSRPPQKTKTKSLGLFYSQKFPSLGASKKRKTQPCPVHRGLCSSHDTFCLLEANAVERLLGCLDHENAEVVEAALSALCTLLDDKVDVDKSVSILTKVNTIKHVLNVVKDYGQDGLLQKSFWIIERFLMRGGDKSTSDISQDKQLPALLVSAFHHGGGNTRQIAEKILRYLNKMPETTLSHCTF